MLACLWLPGDRSRSRPSTKVTRRPRRRVSQGYPFAPFLLDNCGAGGAVGSTKPAAAMRALTGQGWHRLPSCPHPARRSQRAAVPHDPIVAVGFGNVAGSMTRSPPSRVMGPADVSKLQPRGFSRSGPNRPSMRHKRTIVGHYHRRRLHGTGDRRPRLSWSWISAARPAVSVFAISRGICD
jgi:hypothetical protein